MSFAVMPRRHTTALSLLLCLGLLAGCGGTGSKNQLKARPNDTRPAYPVQVMAVPEPDTFEARTFKGTVRSAKKPVILAPTEGIVERVFVQNGQTVRKDTPILKLKTDLIRRETERLQLELAQAQADYQLALMGNAPPMPSPPSPDNEDGPQAVSPPGGTAYPAANPDQAAKAKARFDRLLARMKSLRTRLAETKLKMPYTAKIKTLLVRENEYLRREAPFIELQSDRPVIISAPIPAALASQLRQARESRAVINGTEHPAQLQDVAPDRPGKSYREAVFQVSPELSRSLSPGQAVRIRVELPGTGPMLVPSLALTLRKDKPRVFVAERQGQALVAVERLVETGRYRKNDIEILSGLSSGEKLIVEGQYALTDRQRIRIREDKKE